jgi:hypothetical protein
LFLRWVRVPVIPALWRLRQEDGEFKACLGLHSKLFKKQKDG